MSKTLGILVVVVLKAKNLHDIHSFYKQDPFAQVTLGGTTHKTEVDVKGGQHPEWDAEFRFPILDDKGEQNRTLDIICWRKEARKDEEIGKGQLAISDTIKTGEFDDWVPIKDSGGVYRGEIYLEMTFYSSGPPPLERRPTKLQPTDRLTRLNQDQPPQMRPTGAASRHTSNTQHLRVNPSETHLQAIPGSAESPIRVPTILRPGARSSGPIQISQKPSVGGYTGATGLDAKRSTSQPALSSSYPGSLIVESQSPSGSPHTNFRPASYHSPDPISVRNGSPSQRYQHTPVGTNYSPPGSYGRDYSRPSTYRPDPVASPGAARNDYIGPVQQPVGDHRRPQSEVPEPSSSLFFPMPQIVLSTDYAEYPGPPSSKNNPPPQIQTAQISPPPQVLSSGYSEYPYPSSPKNDPPPQKQPILAQISPPPQVLSSGYPEYPYPPYSQNNSPPQTQFVPAQIQSPQSQVSSSGYPEYPFPSSTKNNPPPQTQIGHAGIQSPQPQISSPGYQEYPYPISSQNNPPPQKQIVSPQIQSPPYPPPQPYNDEFSIAQQSFPYQPPAYIIPPQNSQPQPQYRYDYPPPSQPQTSIYRLSEPEPKSLEDPHLIARYNTPLPLPADNRSERKNSVQPPPKAPSPPAPKIETPTLPARNKKTQEELDAELARQLDMELNLVGQRMPGQY